MLLITTMRDKAAWLRQYHPDRIENPARLTIAEYKGMEFARLYADTGKYVHPDSQAALLADLFKVPVTSIEARSSNIFSFIVGRSGSRPETPEVRAAVDLLDRLRFPVA
jgi:hypothetical protein